MTHPTKQLNEVTITITCPIVGCVGPAYDADSHAETDPAKNLHNAATYDSELVHVVPAMFTATEGRWILDVSMAQEMTPAETITAAAELIAQAERVQAMNDEIDTAEAAEWVAANPDWGNVPMSRFCRIKPLSLIMEILAQLKVGA